MKLGIKKILQLIRVAVIFLVLLIAVQGFSSVQVSAQPAGSPANFTLSDCAPVAGSSASGGSSVGGANVLIKCFQQISTIVLIAGVVIAVINAGRDVLQSYIPGESVDANKNFQERIKSLLIGIILISLPGAILSLINPAATNLDFLSGIRRNTTSGSTTGGGSGGGGIGGNGGFGGGIGNTGGGNGGNTGNNGTNGGQNNQTTTTNSGPNQTGVQFSIDSGKCSMIPVNVLKDIYNLKVCNDPSSPYHYSTPGYASCFNVSPNQTGGGVKVSVKPNGTCTVQDALNQVYA